MNRFPLPDDKRLQELIRESCEYMSGPDMTRLQSLEQRLSRQLVSRNLKRKPNKLPWWVVLLLVGGFASAAWWKSEQWLDKVETDTNKQYEMLQHRQQNKTVSNADKESSEPDSLTGDAEHGNVQQSPIIYQRENF